MNRVSVTGVISNRKRVDKKYRTSSGIIVMCMHCRRTLSKTGSQWDLVEEFIQNRPQDVSEGVCNDCLKRHYTKLDA